MQNRAIPEGPATDKQVLQPGTGHIILRPAHQAMHGNFAVVCLHFQQSVGQGLPIESADPRSPAIRHNQIMHPAAVVGERHGHRRVGQSGAHKGFRGVRPFGGGRP